MRIVSRNSPNQSPRLPGDVNLIICHTPEGAYDSTVAWCLRPGTEVSYHLLIKKDGSEATQLVPWDRKAWHAKVYNSISDGVAIEGWARLFDLGDAGIDEFVDVVAKRLIARNLKPVWTTDVAKGGVCRHGDLQRDRTDPTPDLNEWRLFMAMVAARHKQLTQPDWPIPVPKWFWTWARWRLGVGEFKQYGPASSKHRPGLPVPPPGISWAPGGKHFWAWRRLRALVDAQKA
jgi:hypothetical protein